MRRIWALGWLLVAGVFGCGGPGGPPARRVIETSIGGWTFGRYQKVIDVEVWVSDRNPAVAHTASYVRTSAQRAGHIDEEDVANVFVTEYRSPIGVLRAVVKFARRLAQESGYRVEEHGVDGVRVITIKGQGESWALWASGKYVVKVGGRGLDDVPGTIVTSYADRYPVRMPGGLLEGPLPPGEPEPPPPPKEEYDPKHPKPDWNAGQKGGK